MAKVVVGAGILAFPFIWGVTAIGPLVGGIFAGLQAGVLVTAGSILASTQSVIMTGVVTNAGAATVGLGVTAITAAREKK